MRPACGHRSDSVSSVSDRDSQFILAQATKSLVDPASQLSGDEEWDGWCRLSNRIWPMCRVSCLFQFCQPLI
jgi:hypothetical protein